MSVEYALTSSKHVRAPAAADVADKVAAVAGSAANLLERDCALDESGNCRIGVLSSRDQQARGLSRKSGNLPEPASMEGR